MTLKCNRWKIDLGLKVLRDQLNLYRPHRLAIPQLTFALDHLLEVTRVFAMSSTLSSLGLSVLMHNDALYARECLDSIAKQWRGEWTDVHLLVNGSSDGTDALVQEWAASRPWKMRPRVHISAENLGPMGGLIRLLTLCQTEYVVVLHGDDLLLDGFAEHLQEDIALVNETTILIRDLTVLRQNPDGVWAPNEILERSLVRDSQTWNQFAMTIFNIAGMPGAILPVKYSLLLLSDQELPPLLAAEDWYLFSKVLAHGGALHRSTQANYGYRLHQTNTTNSPLQPYSAGFVRGVQQEQGSRLLRLVSRLQIERERQTFKAVEIYDRGLNDGWTRSGIQTALPHHAFRWTAIPFLLALKAARLIPDHFPR